MAGPTALIAASAGAQAVGSLVAGHAQQKAAEFNARVAERQGVVAQQNAAANEAAFRREMERRMGARRAAAGASGVAVAGSSLAVLEDAAREEELSALNIRYRGALDQASAESQAKVERFRGKIAMSNAISSAGSSLLGGGAKIAMMRK